MGYFVKKRVNGPDGINVPTGTTAERPANPTESLLRYNVDTKGIEYYDGTNYVELAKTGMARPVVNSFVGDGISVTFGPLTYSPGANVEVLVFVDGYFQSPTVNYSVSGTDIVFTSAPPNGVPIAVIYGTSATYVTSANVFDVPNI